MPTNKEKKLNSQEQTTSNLDNVQDNFKTMTNVDKPIVPREGWKERLFQIHNSVVSLKYKDEIRSSVGIADNITSGKSNENSISREEPRTEDELVVTGSYEFEKTSIELEEGVSVIIPPTSGVVSEGKDKASKASKTKDANTVIFFSPNAEMVLKPTNMGNVAEQKVKLAMLHLISIAHTGDKGEVNDIEISAYLRDSVKFDLNNGYTVELKQGEYTKRSNSEQGILKFWDTKVTLNKEDISKKAEVEVDATKREDWLNLYHTVDVDSKSFRMKNPKQKADVKEKTVLEAESAETDVDGFSAMMKNFQYDKSEGASFSSATVKSKLNYGKKEDNTQGNPIVAEDFVEFNIENNLYGKDGFENEIQSTNIAASNKLTEINEDGIKRKASVLKKEIYTRDGFAKIEKPKFEFVKKKDGKAQIEGDGKVEFLPVPYVLTMSDGSKKTGKAIGTEAVEDVSFIIDADGNLKGVFKDDAEATLNLNMVKKKSNDAESIIRKFTLGKLSIKDGYLEVASLRMDEGVKIEKEEDDTGNKLLKIFDCSMKGTIATESKEAKITPEGIEATMKKTTFGTYEVEDFMGFLGGKIDYPKGSIEVSAKKEADAENLEDSFFSFSGDYSVDIPTGILGLNAKFGVKPSASIGGTVGLKLERGEPFDNEWENGAPLEIKGNIETEGKAGIGAEAGVELGIPGIANIDLVVEGGLSLKVSGKLEGGTGFQYNKDDSKFKQNKNFEFKGELGGELEGTIGLSSGVKFLFWKMQMFNFEFLKKKLGSLKFSFEGEKKYDSKGLMEGWTVKSKQFSAEWFSKEIQKKYKDNSSNETPIKTYTSEELQKMLDEKIIGAENAWATLCALRDKEKDTVIFFDKKDDKKTLGQQIEDVTKEVTKKITECINLLNESNKVLEEEKKAAALKVQDTKKKLNDLAKQNNLSNDVFEKAAWGGFDVEDAKYKIVQVDESKKKKEKNKIEEQNNENLRMAAVDLMIARMLGEVSEQNKAKIKADYNEEEHVWKNKKGKVEDRFAQLNPKEQDDIYKERTKFLESEVSFYDDQTSFYALLNEKVLYNKERMIVKDEDTDRTFGVDIDNNNRPINGGLTFKFARELKNFPKIFRNIINKDMTMSEFLKIVLKNDLGATAKDKWDLLKMAFGIQAKIKDKMLQSMIGSAILDEESLIQGGLARATNRKFAEVFFEKGNSSLDDVIKKHNVMNIFEERKKLQSDFEAAGKAKENAEAQLAKIQNSISEIKKKQEDYNQKLISLKDNAELALKNKAFDANAAKKVVSIYSEEYVKKMKNNKEIENTKTIKEGLIVAESNTPKPILKGAKKNN